MINRQQVYVNYSITNTLGNLRKSWENTWNELRKRSEGGCRPVGVDFIYLNPSPVLPSAFSMLQSTVLNSLDHLLVTLVMITKGDGVGLKAASQNCIFDCFWSGSVMPLAQITVAVGVWWWWFLLDVEEATTWIVQERLFFYVNHYDHRCCSRHNLSFYHLQRVSPQKQLFLPSDIRSDIYFICQISKLISHDL